MLELTTDHGPVYATREREIYKREREDKADGCSELKRKKCLKGIMSLQLSKLSQRRIVLLGLNQVVCQICLQAHHMSW